MTDQELHDKATAIIGELEERLEHYISTVAGGDAVDEIIALAKAYANAEIVAFLRPRITVGVEDK